MAVGVALGVATAGGAAVGDADAMRTGGGDALGVAEDAALGEGVAVAVGTGATAIAVELDTGVGVGLGEGVGFVGETEATGRVADFVGLAIACGSSTLGSPGPTSDVQMPKPMMSNAKTAPPIKIHFRACASSGATTISGGASGPSSCGTDSRVAAVGRGCRGPLGGGGSDLWVPTAGEDSVKAGFGGGFQPGGGSICTMPLHFGQARICPIALSCRTFNRAWQVMQVTEKSSTGAVHP